MTDHPDAGTGDTALDWAEFEAIVVTNEEIDAYDGTVQIGDAALESIATSLSAGTVPLQGQHDARLPIRSRNLRSWVEDGADGIKRVRLTGEVVRDDLDRAGPIGGFSATVLEPLPELQWPRPATSALSLAADVGWFNDASLVEALSELQEALASTDGTNEVGGTFGSRLYQFSAIPDARIVVETSLALFNSLGPNLLASAIWDGVKILIARKRVRAADSPTVIEINVQTPNGIAKAVVRTMDAEVARAAIERLPDATALLSGTDQDARKTMLWPTVEAGSDPEQPPGWMELGS